MMRLILQVVATMAIAGPALAQQTTAADEGLLGWSRQAGLVESTIRPAARWEMLGALQEGLVYATVTPPNASRIAKVGLRLERFAPKGAVRSEVVMYDVDCRQQLVRATYEATYPDHNLVGGGRVMPPSGGWFPVQGKALVRRLKDEACSAKTPTAAPPIDIDDGAAVQAWIRTNDVRERNVQGARQWSLIDATAEGVVYASLEEANERNRTGVLTLRLERFLAAPYGRLASSLSQTTDYEFNCRDQRFREVGTSVYTDRNLQGPKDGQQRVGLWTPIAANPLLARPVADLCTELQVSREGINSLNGGRGNSWRPTDGIGFATRGSRIGRTD